MQPYGGQSPPRSPPWSTAPRPRPTSAAYDFSGNDPESSPLSRRFSTGNNLHSAAMGVGGASGTGGNGRQGGSGQYGGGSARPSSRPTSAYGPPSGPPGPSTALQEQGGGNGGNGGSGDAYRGKVNQLVQNFFMKAAMIVIQARIPVQPLYASRTNTRKVNKWVGVVSGGDDFNIELDDTDAFKEELQLWKTCDAYDPALPPLIIETYIDAKDLTSNQTLVILDEQGKRWNVDTAMSGVMNTSPTSRNAGRVTDPKPDVVLERWTIELRPRNEARPAPELPVVYKLGIVFFRSLFAYTRLMPTQKLWKRLMKLKLNSALKVNCRIMMGEIPARRWDGLEMPLVDGEGPVTDRFSFGKVDTPAGEVHINVGFRRNTEFRVDDSEAVFSSHFINMDEHFFEPSLNSNLTAHQHQHQHQRTHSQPQISARRDPVPLPPTNPSLRPESGQTYGSYSSLNQAVGISASPIAAARAGHINTGTPLSGSPGDPVHMNIRSIQGSKSSLRSVDGGIQRRPSISFMHPFKSPSLSASPSSDILASSPRASVARLSTGATAPIAARARPGVSPITPRSSLPHESPIPAGISDSPKPTSSSRYSSSFGQRRPRPLIGTSRTEDDNSSGRGSYSSSMAAPGSGMFPPIASTVGFQHEDDQNVADFLKLLDEKPPLKLFDPAESAKRTGSALQKYQKMKDSHNMLSESLSASLILQKSGSTSAASRPMSNVPNILPHSSSFSPSSSPGKPTSPYTPHTPAVPSRLSEGLTADYHDRTHHRSHHHHHQRASFEDTPRNLEGTSQRGTSQQTAATTSPLDIPSSPRPFSGGPRRPSSFSQHHQSAFDNSSEYDGPNVYGPPTSCSLGSVDMVPLSLSKLVDLQMASEEDLPGRESIRADDGYRAPKPILEQQRDQERPPRGGYGVLGSVTSSVRGRFYRERGRGSPASSTAALERERGGSGSSTISERPSVFGRRTPSYSRGNFGEDEDLLFAMSDMRFDPDKAGGDGGKGSETSASVSRKDRGTGRQW